MVITSVNISEELNAIKKGIDDLFTTFSIEKEKTSYTKFEENYDKLIKNNGKITHYLGNINNKLIENTSRARAKQVISILTPKDNNTTIQGVMNKNE